MDKEEILQKSRAENAAAYLDERERSIRLRGDSAALCASLAFAALLLVIKLCRGQPAADLLTLIMGMSASGFAYRAVKEKKKSDIILTVLSTTLTALYFIRFLMGAA